MLSATIGLTAFAQAPDDWENPDVNSIGRRAAHAYAMPLASVQAALEAELEPETPYVKSLNGDWKISWCGDPARRPMDFFKTDFDDSNWQTIDVPSCVELRGFGNPGYVNVRFPHENKPPYIRDVKFNTPDYNPVSSYRTTFTVPEGWAGRNVIIRFDGVYSAYYVWVNGEKVGYAEDSKLPDEFDITAYLKPGENLLAVQVFRWCDGSYLEDQDMFRFSGIFRDVTLIAEPEKPVEDFFFSTDLSKDYKTSAILSLKVKSELSPKAELYDAAGKVVARFNGRESTATLRKPHLWSAEDPYLYTLVIRAGKDIRSTRVGIKKVEIEGTKMLVNGQKLKFKGVNRHEHSASNGRTVSYDEMLQDILLMKRFNINTVRTSHYPDHHTWYDLCDKYGIYVVAEANVEGHGAGYGEHGFGQFEMWNKSIVERNANQVLNYRNHPSIFMWSLGNETGHGQCFVNARDAIKELDPTRPVHWERGNETADVESCMYPAVEFVRKRGTAETDSKFKDKPFFMCEYAHAMGNAIGNLQEYWDAIYASDNLMGGCIWDWVDQALLKDSGRFDAQGNPVKFYAYGGDFDEQPNDGPFCCNGVIRPDRQVTAKLVEVGHVYRQIAVESGDAASGKAMIWNRFSYTDVNKYDASWAVLEDGVVIAEGEWDVPSVLPGTKVEVSLPETGVEMKGGREYFMNVCFKLKEDELWAEKGHIIASDQLPMKNVAVASASASGISKVKVVEDSGTVTVSSDAYKAVFCRKAGTVVSLEVGGKQILATDLKTVAGPRLTVMRAFVDNDGWLFGLSSGNTAFNYFGLTQLHHQARGIKVEELADGSVCVDAFVDVTGSKSAGFEHDALWTFAPDGTISVKSVVDPYGRQPGALPRLGLSWMIDSSLENVEWYGRGPGENYVDRCTGSFIGRYSSTVTDMYEQYVRPQDNGYRSDVRWFELKDTDGHGVRFSADFPMFVQALHYNCEDLLYARHRNGELRRNQMPEPRKEVCLNIDLRQLGLGGASCGPRPLAEYTPAICKETFTITISSVR